MIRMLPLRRMLLNVVSMERAGPGSFLARPNVVGIISITSDIAPYMNPRISLAKLKAQEGETSSISARKSFAYKLGAYELMSFSKRKETDPIMIDELASELGLGPSLPVHAVLHDWLRHTDGKLSFLGFVKLLHGVSSRTIKAH